MTFQNKNILICPLDWGLGHATRCMPIIKSLQSKGCKVYIASSGRSLDLLKDAFPELQHFALKPYSITYSNKGMFLAIVRNIPRIIYTIYKEHKQIDKLIKTYNFDVVISDNRFGCFSKKAESIYITHQVMAKMPPAIRFMEPFVAWIHSLFIRNYNQIWIPDVPGKINLSGDLAHKPTFPNGGSFVGLLSRFSRPETIPEQDIELLVMISGPEPSRTLFEKKILSQLHKLDLEATVLLGLPQLKKDLRHEGKLTIYTHCSSDEILNLILRSKIVLTRSGYTTIMELACLGKKAIIIPTPGQTEQEYLAVKYHHEKLYLKQNQSELDIKAALDKAHGYGNTFMDPQINLLDSAIDKTLSKL